VNPLIANDDTFSDYADDLGRLLHAVRKHSGFPTAQALLINGEGWYVVAHISDVDHASSHDLGNDYSIHLTNTPEASEFDALHAAWAKYDRAINTTGEPQ